ncbi:MAG: [Fe-Fe] hydrogenase large subunit C-terminal domain-containing protein [Clostridiaceae bacterium]
MLKTQEEIFKNLIQSYGNESFDEYVNNLIKESQDKEYTKNLLASLCGVTVDNNVDYLKSLKYAISNYKEDHKVVNKIKDCSNDCVNENGKTKCELSCPFNAIFHDKKDNEIKINGNLCIDCGLCIDSCEKGCFLDKIEYIPLLNLLKSDKKIIAAVAPAIVGQFGDKANINRLRHAFKKLGFFDMVEVAFFADMLTLKEAVEFNHLVKKKDDLMITSCCCPMWVAMIKKVYSQMIKHVSPSISPMIAAGRVLKTINKDCSVVFIGPCIAKKAEAKDKDLLGDIDFVLTFAELKSIFESLNIDVENLEEDISSEYASKGGRIYARAGGVSIAVKDAVKDMYPKKYELLNSTYANGVRECKEILNKISSGDIDSNFIEGMGCVGGCVGGPKAIISKENGKDYVDEFANNSKIQVPTKSTCMMDILNKIGIESIDDFKNEEKTKIFHRNF